jgi:hypothetical protein
MTAETTGCASGNCSAAAGNGTPCRSQTAPIASAFAVISGGAVF